MKQLSAEEQKDFNKAYRHLMEQMKSKGIPLSDQQEQQLLKPMYVNPQDFLRKEKIFEQLREENIMAKQQMQALVELEECTFEPNTYRSKRPGEEYEQP